MISDHKKLIEDLDWKKSKLYTDYVLMKKPWRSCFENDTKLFKEDEVDYIKTMLKDNNESLKT